MQFIRSCFDSNNASFYCCLCLIYSKLKKDDDDYDVSLSCFYVGPAPDPPFNVSAQLLSDGGLMIAWLPPRHSLVPVDHYIIEYRTVGQWVPLTDNVERVFYEWKRPSRGATYHFRVISCSQTGARSEFSPVHTVTTTGFGQPC